MAQPLALGVMTQFTQSPLASLQAIKALIIPTVQVLYPQHLDNQSGIAAILEAQRETGNEITTVFCGYPGESYADIPTVQATVGLVPPHSRQERLARTRKIAQFANRLGVQRIGAHIGFVPEASEKEQFDELVQVIETICLTLAEQNHVFALETGQETAAALRDFLEAVNAPNLFVNFDPANMILYGQDHPISALDLLMPWIDGVHCKDGKWPTESGQLGEETPLGQGDVQFADWLQKLVSLGYQGPLTMEREISGPEQAVDIAHGRDLIFGLLGRR